MSNAEASGDICFGNDHRAARVDVVIDYTKKRARRGPKRKPRRKTWGWTPRDAEAYAKELDQKVEDLKQEEERRGEQPDKTTRCQRLEEAVVEVATRHQVPPAENETGASLLEEDLVEKMQRRKQ